MYVQFPSFFETKFSNIFQATLVHISVVDIKVWYRSWFIDYLCWIASQLKRTMYANQINFLMSALIKSVLISGK